MPGDAATPIASETKTARRPSSARRAKAAGVDSNAAPEAAPAVAGAPLAHVTASADTPAEAATLKSSKPNAARRSRPARRTTAGTGFHADAASSSVVPAGVEGEAATASPKPKTVRRAAPLRHAKAASGESTAPPGGARPSADTATVAVASEHDPSAKLEDTGKFEAEPQLEDTPKFDEAAKRAEAASLEEAATLASFVDALRLRATPAGTTERRVALPRSAHERLEECAREYERESAKLIHRRHHVGALVYPSTADEAKSISNFFAARLGLRRVDIDVRSFDRLSDADVAAGLRTLTEPAAHIVALHGLGFDTDPRVFEAIEWADVDVLVIGYAEPGATFGSVVRRHLKHRIDLQRPARAGELVAFPVSPDASARRHPDGTVQPDNFPIEHLILDDVPDESGVFFGPSQTRRKRHLFAERLLSFLR
jgi:hypothetical protein